MSGEELIGVAGSLVVVVVVVVMVVMVMVMVMVMVILLLVGATVLAMPLVTAIASRNLG
ncbi:hypothetical protein [Pseudomonas sp. ok602]|uniref:hypothetical protein n=1 Tax=Pseudomonas sp. ok602 TaxID=1761898 RepID=UPI00158778A8|nr:hypothetical protein [Pseudomonas sp. ok602]